MAENNQHKYRLLRALTVWQRNYKVWKKLIWPSVIGHFGEPLIFLLAFGYGVGKFIGDIAGVPYPIFIASGILCASAMNSATHDCLYSAYTRMNVEHVWWAILSAPLAIEDIVLGEVLWAATKSLMSGFAILTVATILGLIKSWTVLAIIPVLFLTGCCFASLALMVMSFAHSYDFFMYYVTLIIIPLVMLSGVYFPIEGFPAILQNIIYIFPLAHTIAIVRPIVLGGGIDHFAMHFAVLVVYTLIAYCGAVYCIRRRLLD